jgi:hypothetical protein
VFIYAGGELYIERESTEAVRYCAHTGIDARIVNDFTEMQGSMIKMLLMGETGYLRHIEREMKALFSPERCNIVFSAKTLLEFGPVNAHKGYGIRFLADCLHIPMGEAIALGDEANDVPMLKAAGLGIAVANAVPIAKKAATITLDYTNDQNALSHAIHTYLLG